MAALCRVAATNVIWSQPHVFPLHFEPALMLSTNRLPPWSTASGYLDLISLNKASAFARSPFLRQSIASRNRAVNPHLHAVPVKAVVVFIKCNPADNGRGLRLGTFARRKARRSPCGQCRDISGSSVAGCCSPPASPISGWQPDTVVPRRRSCSGVYLAWSCAIFFTNCS